MPLLCRSYLKSRGILCSVGGVVAQMSQEGRQVFETFTEARWPQWKREGRGSNIARAGVDAYIISARYSNGQSPVKQQAIGQWQVSL